ncbi:hypothetical protein [Candidatus Oleimmundimicrobium sp.]|uniref:hypothetical protein n=1 Tax=Candidatus Oleimmundimicrobium sp. TaxID=3060597 RepID=UPI0027187C22|nr:hypothetical protein [Candidatus Oleimmundimicrobium sp.]MDO8886168.1 hypothetical protein [Candidatus Oleimmundimicrobium sp.]
MAKYTAFIEQTGSYPGVGYGKKITAKRIDAINRAILKTGKAWQGLELPRAIKLGHMFQARFDGYSIQIYKES